MNAEASSVIWFEKLGRGDVARVGGKNASLCEMVRNLDKKGVRVCARCRSPEIRKVPTWKAERAEFVLNDQDILTLARWACVIEDHYGCPMDMEWTKDGESGELLIVQARPETVQSRKEASAFRSYRIKSKDRKLVSGLSIGDAIVAGHVCLIESPRDIGRFVDGAILVTQTTDPDLVPIMKRAVAIITNHGDRTSHAVIANRELRLPAIVGTGNATHMLHDDQEVTASFAEGDEGFVYEGHAEYETENLDLESVPAGLRIDHKRLAPR